MAYSITKSRQRFSMWAACRAAQAGSAKAKRKELIPALARCGVVEFLSQSPLPTITEDEYDTAFDGWVTSVKSTLESDYGKPVSYGIAAKLISTYIKSVFVLAGAEQSEIAHHAHPPIDGILLKGVDKQHETTLSTEYKWQSLDRAQYKKLVNKLRAINGGKPFCQLEEHWHP
jgi:hypothetical protein